MMISDQLGEGGFTLIEVMVALIILGISSGAIFQSLSQSKRISWKSDEVMETARIAHNILVDSALIDTALRDKEKEGAVEGETGWHYVISVSPLELETENAEELLEVPSMVKLNLCLIHKLGQKEKSFCLTRWYRR